MKPAASTELSPESRADHVTAKAISAASQSGDAHAVVPLGEDHLRLLAREYVEHYHRERNHQGLDNRLLQHGAPPQRTATTVKRRDGIPLLRASAAASAGTVL